LDQVIAASAEDHIVSSKSADAVFAPEPADYVSTLCADQNIRFIGSLDRAVRSRLGRAYD
jgi:hypothetical protein